ncbi:MAG TPA: B-box zinc finger protein [Anaerolineales bacterium]|nr:B-box zinc finger protein [Anaerolineales bacterium]
MTNSTPIMVCANHPDTETTLRCNRCEKPICPRCAVQTPTGYRCKECVRGQQRIFDTSLWYDYPVAILIASILGFLGSLFVPRIGFFAIFIGPIVGSVIAEAVRRITNRRRSRGLFISTTVAAAVGCTIQLLPLFLNALIGGGFGSLLGLLWYGIYTFGVVSSLYYRLSGIRIQ